MYTLKKDPKDFIVEEISGYNLDPSGSYSIYKLTKEDYTTLNACKLIAKINKNLLRDIGFAGSKDRRAITTQYISLRNVRHAHKKSYGENITLEYIGQSKNPLSLGDLKGNKFIITLYDIKKEPKIISQSINYFDDQRFSKNNHLVGKAILKKKYGDACDLLDEFCVSEHLISNPSDYVGALKRLPLKTLYMFIHAYQSFIFNNIVAKYLSKLEHTSAEYNFGTFIFPKESVEDFKVPLVGFEFFESENEEIEGFLEDFLEKDKINPRSFVNKQIPELTFEGNLRNVIVQVKDFSSNIDSDKVVVEFTLPKGSYATVVIKKMFS